MGTICEYFTIFLIFCSSRKTTIIKGYLPQQFLYFLPEPQVEANPVYIVFIILLLFQRFVDSVTLVFIVLYLL